MNFPTPAASPNAIRAVLWGGLLAGVFDLAFAFTYYGPRLGLVQAIAAGLIGKDFAFRGGIMTALLGVLLHFMIATIWAAIFWGLSRWISALVRYAVLAGLVYGLVIFYGMNCFVLPLSGLQTKAWPPSFAPWPVAMHMLIIGLPIALVTRKLSHPGAPAT